MIGPTQMLRSLQYVSGKGDKLPTETDKLEELGGTLETLLPETPMLQAFVSKNLAQTHLSVITKTVDYKGFEALDKTIRQKWKEAVAKDPDARQVQDGDRRAGAAAGQDLAAPRADADAELRAHRGHHLRHVPPRLPQRGRRV